MPLYHQLARDLKAAVADGRIATGSFLENELELADRWQVSRPTVRRAIQELVDSGLLVRQRGVGTQVVNRESRPDVRISGLYDVLIAEGRAPTTTVLKHEYVIADELVGAALMLDSDRKVLHLERCRYADGKRLAIMRNWLRSDIGEGLGTADLATNGLYALLRIQGIQPHVTTQSVGARTASPIDAALLDLRVGAPLLTTSHITKDRSGRPFDVGEHVYDGVNYEVTSTIVET